MKTTRKIFLALVLTLVVAAVMSVCAFAFDIDTDLPSGVQKGETGWVDSGYADIDAENSGWTLIGVPSDFDKVANSAFPKLTFFEKAYFYWNKTAKKGVWIPTRNDMSSNSGMATVIDPRNPDVTTDGGKKLYTIACAFIDIAEEKQAAFSGIYVGGYIYKDSAYTDLAKTRPLWARYHAKGYATAGNWDSISCTADQYTLYTNKKTELSATLSGEDLEDALVEYVLANITGISTARNCLVDGVQYNTGWIFKQLEDNGYVFESLEIRAGDNSAPVLGTVGYVLSMIETKTVLFDSKITGINIGATWRGLFREVANLKTVAHVTYDADKSGKYTGTVTENVVDLSGFATVTPYSSGANIADRIFYYASGIENVVYFTTLKSGETENAGWVDAGMFEGASSLKTFTMNAPLTKLSATAFGACTKLATLDLKGGIAAGATVHSTAFNGVSAVEIIVYSVADGIRAKALFSDSKFTITNANPIPDELNDAITADGYSIRLNDDNAKTPGPALRAEFTLLQSNVKAAADLGYTLSNYGVIVFSANTLNGTAYNGDIAAVLEAAKAGTDARVIKKSAVNGPYVNGAALETNPDLDKVFAAAVTGIPEGNFTSAVYTYAYAEWTNGGETTYTYTTYTSDRTKKTAHSLYDATVFAFMSGIANSQNTDADKLWPVLDKGAFSITDGEQKGFANGLSLNVDYNFTDEDGNANTANTFTYSNLPLRKWIFGNLSSTGAVQWNSAANRLEETSSTNVVWSLLTDTMADGTVELVVAYRRAPGAAEDAVATIPRIRDRGSTGGFAPYSSSYFTPGTTYTAVDSTTGNGLYKQATIYSPILTEANENKIKTLVVDYGVNAFATSALENTTVGTLETIVYPEGMTAVNNILAYNYYVKNIVYASATKTSLTAATQVEDFGAIADLSGLATMSANYAFTQAQNLENVILPESVTYSNGVEEFLYNTYKLKRIWTVGTDVPADGTVDLTGTVIKSFAKNCLTGVSKSATVKSPTIIMPEGFEGVSAYGYKFSEAGACSQAFGADATYTIVLQNSTALTNKGSAAGNYGLIAFYENMLAATGDVDGNGTVGNKISQTTIVYELTTAQGDNLDHLMFTCEIEGEGTMTKTIAEWKTYFEEKAAEEAEPTILPFTAGLNVNGMETFLSDNQWGSFETGVENVTKASTYSDIRSKGFDYVRIPVNFYTIYYEATDYDYTTEQLMGYLDTGIEYALANDLYVMIDFHGWFYIGEEENDYEEFLYCWTQVANRYKDASEKVIFELLNEPWYTDGKAQTYLSDSKLYAMQAEAVEIIRNTGSNNATRLIVLCTADGNKAWKLPSMVLPDDDNIAVAIHEYEPYNFTHQNFEWAGLDGQTTTLEAQGGFTSATSWDFTCIKNFIADHPKVPIILNEFGLNLVKATAADTETYLTGITSFCTENNIPWAYWQYYGGYSSDGAMSLYRQENYWSSFAWDETALGYLFASASAS